MRTPLQDIQEILKKLPKEDQQKIDGLITREYHDFVNSFFTIDTILSLIKMKAKKGKPMQGEEFEEAFKDMRECLIEANEHVKKMAYTFHSDLEYKEENGKGKN